MVNEDLAYRTVKATEEDVLLEQAKRREDGYITSERATVTASGGSFNVHLKNPSGSETDANVRRVTVNTQFEGIVDVWDGFTTAPSGGTEVFVDNLLMDSGDTNGDTVMESATNVSFDGENMHLASVLPSGGPGGTIGGLLAEGEPLIEPGREIVVEVTNQSGSAADAAITIVYVEEPRG